MAFEGFNITGMTNASAMDRINVCFDKLQKMIDEYEPAETEQEYAVFTYNDKIDDNGEFYLSKCPTKNTPIFATPSVEVIDSDGNSYFYPLSTSQAYIGDLHTTGLFKASSEVAEWNGYGEELDTDIIWIAWMPYRYDKNSNPIKEASDGSS